MFRLTRQVRFSIGDAAASAPGGNGWSGVPELGGFGRFFQMDVAVAGELDDTTQYLINIKSIDQSVREQVVPRIAAAIAAGNTAGPAPLLPALHAALAAAIAPVAVDSIRLWSSPYQSVALRSGEIPMVRFSQQFEFAASHRLHNPALDDEQNRTSFGKCNNPLGHGHNYVVEVAMIGTPDDAAPLVDQDAFRAAVTRVIDRFDHRYLNHELPEFARRIPTVENIAKVIYGLLKDPLAGARARLASVTVWETPKTSCEYSE